MINACPRRWGLGEYRLKIKNYDNGTMNFVDGNLCNIQARRTNTYPPYLIKLHYFYSASISRYTLLAFPPFINS